jgi:transcriptional regulator with XRE-family HTH domain
MNGIEMALHEHFAANVRRRRQELGLTQQELADEIGVHRVFVAQVEAGKAGQSLDTVERFAKPLQCAPLTLLVQPENAEAAVA